MTALRSAILFNNSTGSDTAASGLGPSTAVTGTAAAHTGGVASTTITFTNSPTLSGVQAGDLLWLKTSSGRQFSVIVSVDNTAKTAVVDNSFNIALASAVDYAIGGKRSTLDNADSRKIFEADWADSTWLAEVEYTGTVYTLSTTALTLKENSQNYFRLTGTGGRPEIRQTSNTWNFAFSGTAESYYWILENLQLTNNNATKTSAVGVAKGGGNSGGLRAINVIFGDATNQLLTAVQFDSSAFGGFSLIDCEVKNCTSTGILGNAQYSLGSFVGCEIHNNGGYGVYGFGGQSGVFLDCIIDNNSNHGIYYSSDGIGTGPLVKNCTFHGNSGSGVALLSAHVLTTIITNNIFTNNGGYGIRLDDTHTAHQLFIENNAFRSNTSGETSTVTGATGSVTLTADPYTNTASRNFSLNNTVGGGAACKAAGFPSSYPSNSTTSYVDIGAVQREELGSTIVINRIKKVR